VQAGKELRRTLGQVDMGLFSGAARTVWMNNENKLSDALEHVHHFQTIEELRNAFQNISDAMITIAQAFRPGSETMYVQHCPMADSNKGADWLSKEKEIRNPYYGASMLTCGEVTSTIE
jgi:Cu(I)/Ag(I) efflux system membrane fusion protein